MTKDEMKRRTKCFSLRVLKLCRALPQTVEAQAIRRQLVRSGTSVGANYRAALRARSPAEFRAKLGIVEEEADETMFWLEIIIDDQMLKPERVTALLDEANEIIAITVTTIKNSRKP
ncbi:MAG: four helix bundle protein [Planctomycetota bacterium]